MPISNYRTLGHKLLLIYISGQKTSAQIQRDFKSNGRKSLAVPIRGSAPLIRTLANFLPYSSLYVNNTSISLLAQLNIISIELFSLTTICPLTWMTSSPAKIFSQISVGDCKTGFMHYCIIDCNGLEGTAISRNLMPIQTGICPFLNQVDFECNINIFKIGWLL